MCGIAGFAGEGTRDDLARMNAGQASRGPDGEGIWTDPAQAVYLGHLRLSIASSVEVLGEACIRIQRACAALR